MAAGWNLSLELSPKALAKLPVSGLPPAGTEIFVPFLPGQEWSETLDACRRLVRDSMRPVPHITARTVADRNQLDERLARSVEAGAEAVLLIAGDGKVPAGGFGDTLEILRSGLVEARGPRRLYVAGHPTGHPQADEATLAGALAEKAAFARRTGIAVTVVTQMVFEAEPVMRWLASINDAGTGLPVRVGLAGPTRLRNLMTFALQCGVGAAAEAALARPQSAMRLLGRWTADDVVTDLSKGRAENRCPGLDGLHVYAFGGAGEARDWMARMRKELPDAPAEGGPDGKGPGGSGQDAGEQARSGPDGGAL